jgi:hypothetical protein
MIQYSLRDDSISVLRSRMVGMTVLEVSFLPTVVFLGTCQPAQSNFTRESHPMFIITNISVKKMAIGLEGNIVKYTGVGSITALGICVGG